MSTAKPAGSMLGHTARSEPSQLWVLAGLVGLGFVIEVLYLAFQKR